MSYKITGGQYDPAEFCNETPEKNLACAIVYRAAADYKKYLKQRRDAPSPISRVEYEIELIEWFFHSTAFTLMCKLDPEKLMLDIQEEVNKGE